MSHSPPKQWTTRALLKWTTDYFAAKSIDNPRLSTEMLLAHVLETDRLKLYMDPDRPASELERAAFRELVERAVQHEPVDYLVGKAPFFSMWFEVNKAVLIPRPSTEALVEHVVQHARRTPGFSTPLIIDIGTGSGAIAVCLAKHIPDSRVVATDISAEALAVAKRNAVANKVADRITFLEGDLFKPLEDAGIGQAHYLVSNPPYIPDNEWDAVEPNVKDHEPTIALRAGAEGLDYLAPIIQRAARHMTKPAQLVLEGAAAHMTQLQTLATDAGFTNAHILHDHEALPRVLVADRE